MLRAIFQFFESCWICL